VPATPAVALAMGQAVEALAALDALGFETVLVARAREPDEHGDTKVAIDGTADADNVVRVLACGIAAAAALGLR